MVLKIKHTHICLRLYHPQPRAPAVGGAGSRSLIFFFGCRLRLDVVAPLLDQVMAATGIVFFDTATIIMKQALCPRIRTTCRCALVPSLRALAPLTSPRSEHASVVGSALPQDCRAVAAGAFSRTGSRLTYHRDSQALYWPWRRFMAA